MYKCTSYNCNHWNSKEKLKEKPGSYTMKTIDISTTENSCTWIITHNTESTLEPQFANAPVHEQFGSLTNFPSKKRLG
jgi:hypothetical protein